MSTSAEILSLTLGTTEPDSVFRESSSEQLVYILYLSQFIVNVAGFNKVDHR